MCQGRTLLLWLLCALALAQGQRIGKPMSVIYKWKYFDFVWPSQEERTAAIESGFYDYRKPYLVNVERSGDRRTFVTLPRSAGVPSSLNTVTRQRGEGGNLLKPYPDWSWTEIGNCDGITSAYGIAIDHCDRLWVLDTGKMDDEAVCPPQLLAFDLHTDQLVQRVKIPEDVAVDPQTGKGLLANLVVHAYGPYCNKTTVYIADTEGHGLIVYNGAKFWRLKSSLFAPQEAFSNITIQGESFQARGGILGMALAPSYVESSRRLYFRSLASLNLNSAVAYSLELSNLTGNVKYNRHRNIFSSPVAGMAFTAGGTLFAVPTSEMELVCWNYFKPLNRNYVIPLAYDSERLQFASSLKVIPTHNTGSFEELWIVTNKLQKVYNKTMDFTDDNFRIIRANVNGLLADTPCEAPYESVYRGPPMPPPSFEDVV